MIKLKVKGPIDILMSRYERLIEEASIIERISSKKAMEKLKKASIIEQQIEELKIARYN